MEQYEQLKELVASLAPDFEKSFIRGNNAAGTRVRKGMQDVKALAQDIRSAVQERKKTD